jgi:methylglutaconyl-CoA hydratase
MGAQTTFKKIVRSIDGAMATITLNRPEVRNAFDGEMLRELHHAFEEVSHNDDIRVIVLTGMGKVFCAGADVRHMKECKSLPQEENYKEAKLLADLLVTMYRSHKPVIARVNGPAMGGAVGLVAACDLALTSEKAFFSFSEVRLGLIPACISPYVLRRIGERKTRELFLTARRLDSLQALEYGLVNEVCPDAELDERIKALAHECILGGPFALSMAKQLIEDVTSMTISQASDHTARMLASIRATEEGQEGMAAFFEKRKPSWQTKQPR